MDTPKNTKFSSHLVLTAVLSSVITIILSLIYILLSIASMIFRFGDCAVLNNAAEYFWKLIVAAYITDNENCEFPLDITQPQTVFVLATITMCVSVLCLIAACLLITTVQNEQAAPYFTYAVWGYIGTWVASLVVDLTTAGHFGKDHSTLSKRLLAMDLSVDTIFEIYSTEVLRQGAFLLMTIALKGYVIIVINMVLIILLIVYVMEHQKQVKNDEHSIHKVGALAAYDRPRKPEDNWATQPEPAFLPFARGAQVNNGFSDDSSDRTDRSPRRQPPPRPDYSNRPYDRSDSWHRSQPNLSQSARPFSYLEDIKRPGPSRPPPSPAVETPWNREQQPWQQGPPVPMPDYSPQPRRLKSALKPGYM